MDAVPFTILLNQVINILTSLSGESKAGGASTTRYGEDAYEQGKYISEAVQIRFDQETDGGLASGVLANFMREPEKYRDDLQKRLISLLQADPDFVKKLRSVIARSLCIGRDHELQEYADFLSNDTPWIWTIIGLAGSGKSYLLNQMKKKTPSDIVVIRLDFAFEQHHYDSSTGEREPIDGLTYLGRFVDQLKTACDLQTYADFEKNLEKAFDEDFDNTSIFINQMLHVAPNAEASDNHLEIKTSLAEYLQKARQIRRSQMTFAFHKLMDSFMPNHLVILLDTCEWLMELVNLEVREWLLHEILLPLYESMHQRQKHCHVVTMSTIALPLRLQDNNARKRSSLEPFGKQPVEGYLQRIGVDDPALLGQFYDMTNGHAKYVFILCNLWLQWERESKQISSTETLIQFQKEFNKKVSEEAIQHANRST